jgi:tRNA modification GTPase
MSVLLGGKKLTPRYATRVFVRDRGGEPIDDGLALFFPSPHSFTGEDVLELQLHGSLAVEGRLNEELMALGLEPAGAGAFTMRAFANGRLDLTEAEGLGALLEAETALQHRQALAQLRGGLREKAEGWRRSLIAAMAALEAAVDFPDEEGVPDGTIDQAAIYVDRLREEVDQLLVEAPKAKRLAQGVRIALIGPPNAGKSSLFNALLRENRAIVSEVAGTTRDLVSAHLDIAGRKVELIDSAGIRDATDSLIEREGIERARQAAEEADFRILLYPATDGQPPDWLTALQRPIDLLLRSKADIGHQPGFSVTRSEDVAALLIELETRLDELAVPGPAFTDRQVTLIAQFRRELDEIEPHLYPPEITSELLRRASTCVESLTGRIATDDVLDDIFSAFCIGK